MKRVGFVGLGVMGSRMAANLLAAGYFVIIYNRTFQKMDALVEKGAQPAFSLIELARQAEIICTCLSTPADVAEVYLSEEGLIRQTSQNTITIDLSTTGMEVSQQIFEVAKQHGVHHLDAPVSGGPEGAEAASLTIMVGGEKSMFEQAKPLLEAMGSHIHYLGSSGLGNAAKLFNQYLVGVHTQALAEVLVRARKEGMDLEQLYAILRTSYGDSKILRRHLSEYILPDRREPGGALKYLYKDMVMANQIVSGKNIDQVLGECVEKELQDALLNWGELDMSSLYHYLLEEKRSYAKRGGE